MKIPLEIRQKYLVKNDPEAEFFLDLFDEDRYSRVFEVGANDNHLATMMLKSGFNISSIDLKPYPFPELENHVHLIGDFCAQNDRFWKEERGKFDVLYSVSAIEHFGLNTYGEGGYRPYYDIIAMRLIWDLLKPGGVAYVSVPFGGRFVQHGNDWRVYSEETLKSRIIQDFVAESKELRIVEWDHPNFDTIPSPNLINSLVNGEPYVSCLLKLRKEKK